MSHSPDRRRVLAGSAQGLVLALTAGAVVPSGARAKSWETNWIMRMTRVPA